MGQNYFHSFLIAGRRTADLQFSAGNFGNFPNQFEFKFFWSNLVELTHRLVPGLEAEFPGWFFAITPRFKFLCLFISDWACLRFSAFFYVLCVKNLSTSSFLPALSFLVAAWQRCNFPLRI